MGRGEKTTESLFEGWVKRVSYMHNMSNVSAGRKTECMIDVLGDHWVYLVRHTRSRALLASCKCMSRCECWTA